jgi:hypothetical protein
MSFWIQLSDKLRRPRRLAAQYIANVRVRTWEVGMNVLFEICNRVHFRPGLIQLNRGRLIRPYTCHEAIDGRWQMVLE